MTGDTKEDEFERSLRLGLGRAVLFLHTHDAVPYRETILQAIVHNQAYDPQSEGDRAKYMLDIIDATGEPAFYCEYILMALTNTIEDWDLIHLLAIVRRLAEQGNQRARKLLYDYVEAQFPNSIYGAEEIVVLDGLQSFSFIAELYATNVDPDRVDDWIDGRLLELIEEQFGKEVAQRNLETIAQDNPAVARYLTEITRYRLEKDARYKARTSIADYTYSKIKEIITTKGARSSRGILSYWGYRATDLDMSRAANELLAETDYNQLMGYLYLFRRKPFPLDPTPLLHLAESDDAELAAAATKALVPIHHPAVRALALHLIADPQRCAQGVELLRSNYEFDDHLLIEALLKQSRNPDDVHSIGLDVLAIIADHEPLDADIVTMLTLLYEHSPCSFCRESYVEELLKIGKLPEWMRRECRYDANEEVRQMVQGEVP